MFWFTRKICRTGAQFAAWSLKIHSAPRHSGRSQRGLPDPELFNRLCEMNSLTGRITIDAEICHGKPCIRGMRYPVEAMLEYLAGGDSLEDVLREFPDLEREDLLACLEFARRTLSVRSQHLALS
jgi:uncharacterized protein (DUF433 family)